MSETQETVSNELEHLIAGARDALTDDMVTRLSATAGGGLELLDRINRSGVDRALPAIAQLVENGDVERLVALARLVGAVEDSLSDDIVNRVALILTGLASFADKLVRNEGFLRLIELLGQEEVQDTLVDMLEAAAAAKAESAALPPPKGGIGDTWRLATDPATQQALRFVGLMSTQLNKR